MLSVLNMHWKDWCWSWNSNILATSCEELTHLKRPWCSERLKAGGEGDGRGWDAWMASPTLWTWVWVGSGRWWWTGKPGVLKSMGLQRVRRDWATELKVLTCSFLSPLILFYFICIFVSHINNLEQSRELLTHTKYLIQWNKLKCFN